MIDLMNVYDCPNCGEVLSDQVSPSNDIDADRDKVYDFWICLKCYATVRPRMNGETPALRQVDHERWLWSEGFYGDENCIEDALSRGDEEGF